jgi:hypothetical protein
MQEITDNITEVLNLDSKPQIKTILDILRINGDYSDEYRRCDNMINNNIFNSQEFIKAKSRFDNLINTELTTSTIAKTKLDYIKRALDTNEKRIKKVEIQNKAKLELEQNGIMPRVYVLNKNKSQ